MRILIVSPIGETGHIRKIPAVLGQNGQIELTIVAPEKVALDRIYSLSGWLCMEHEETVVQRLPVRHELKFDVNGDQRR